MCNSRKSRRSASTVFMVNKLWHTCNQWFMPHVNTYCTSCNPCAATIAATRGGNDDSIYVLRLGPPVCSVEVIFDVYVPLEYPILWRGRSVSPAKHRYAGLHVNYRTDPAVPSKWCSEHTGIPVATCFESPKQLPIGSSVSSRSVLCTPSNQADCYSSGLLTLQITYVPAAAVWLSISCAYMTSHDRHWLYQRTCKL